MINYAEKMQYLYKHQEYKCLICGQFLTIQEGLDLHHKYSNTKHGKRKYPLFINSLLNLSLLHSTCHLNKCGGLRITDYNASRYERFLEKHKNISEWLNNPLTENVIQ